MSSNSPPSISSGNEKSVPIELVPSGRLEHDEVPLDREPEDARDYRE